MSWQSVIGWSLLLFWMSLLLVWKEWPDSQLHVIGCDVGQGDAFLIVEGFNQVLVDTGAKEGGVGSCISGNTPFWDRQLELVSISHPQNDHFGALEDLLRQYQIKMLLVPDVVNESEQFQRIVDLAKTKQVAVIPAIQGQRWVLGNSRWEVLWPNAYYANLGAWYYPSGISNQNRSLGVSHRLPLEDINQTSIVLNLSYFSHNMLFTGDIGTEQELSLLEMGLIEPVEVLKVAHHGSKTSSSIEFLQATQPTFAIIGVGASNSYGHPDGEIIEALEQQDTEILRTDTEGEFELVFGQDEVWLE